MSTPIRYGTVLCFILLSPSILGGCATIFSGSKDTVNIKSSPPSKVVINGREYGETPVEADLDRGDAHKVILSKEGYKNKEKILDSGFNWATLLNVPGCGLVGVIICGGIDLATGAAYKVTPDALNVSLEKKIISERKRNKEKSRKRGELVSDREAEAEDFSSPVDTQIPQTDMERPDGIAVVIGNKEYKHSDIPNVDYAIRDAKIMKKYLTRTLGFRKENIIYVNNASGSALTRIFGTGDDPKGKLYNWVKPNTSDVFVYYSGHGAPNPETGNAYLIASNTNPNYLSQNGYPLNQLYENLTTIPAESVTVVLEACFSGISEGGAVVQNASPAVLSVENPVMGMKHGLAFTAGATDQIASWYPDKKHGLFTYYFLKGLRGNADANDDNAVTANEMESYLIDKVPYRARRMFNREQTPQVVGQNLNRVLVRYGDSAPDAQRKATLPIKTTSVKPSVKQVLSLPNGAVKVTSTEDTDALQQGDVITAVNGSDLESKDQLGEIVDQHTPGDTLQLKILREGESQTVSITLTASQ